MNTTKLESHGAVAGQVDCHVRPHETKLQPRPVCPHCGYRHDDAWEWNFGDGLEGDSNGRQCYRCDGEFDCERVVDVSYTTKPTKPHADYPCRNDGRCQYAIDHGAEGLGHCPRGKCVMTDAAGLGA